MSELLFGLLCWLVVAVLASLLVGRFIRLNEADDSEPLIQSTTGLSMLPGYGWEEASTTAVASRSAATDEDASQRASVPQ